MRPAGLGALLGHERARRRRGAVGLLGAAACLGGAAWVTDLDVSRVVDGLPKMGDFLGRLVPPVRVGHLRSDLSEWYWGLGTWLGLLGTTLLMALLATSLGTLGGGPLSFLAARNLSRGSVCWLTRRVLEIARAVPDLVWALVFVFAFGLGPLAGVLAIAVHSLGAQGKLFAEANENVDLHPVEGVRAAGGRWIDEVVYGVLPQVLPNFVSYTFWRLEINVRLATIIGFVGAGGIGVELYDAIALNYIADAGAILLLVVLTVFVIDAVSERLRLALAWLADAGADGRPAPGGA